MLKNGTEKLRINDKEINKDPIKVFFDIKFNDLFFLKKIINEEYIKRK